MIQLYRIIGFFLLVAAIASFFALLALLVDDLREPFFFLIILCSIGLGAKGAVTFYSKTDDDKEWLLGLFFIIGLGMALFVGGVIQWVQ